VGLVCEALAGRGGRVLTVTVLVNRIVVVCDDDRASSVATVGSTGSAHRRAGGF